MTDRRRDAVHTDDVLLDLVGRRVSTAGRGDELGVLLVALTAAVDAPGQNASRRLLRSSRHGRRGLTALAALGIAVSGATVAAAVEPRDSAPVVAVRAAPGIAVPFFLSSSSSSAPASGSPAMQPFLPVAPQSVGAPRVGATRIGPAAKPGVGASAGPSGRTPAVHHEAPPAAPSSRPAPALVSVPVSVPVAVPVSVPARSAQALTDLPPVASAVPVAVWVAPVGSAAPGPAAVSTPESVSSSAGSANPHPAATRAAKRRAARAAAAVATAAAPAVASPVAAAGPQVGNEPPSVVQEPLDGHRRMG